MPSFSLIVGLGNPGKQYETTRHNIGFMLLDLIAEKCGVTFQPSPKWQSHIAKLPGSGILLAKPQTFMNLSGRAIRQISSFYKFPPEEILVIYDDVSLPLGTLRFREKGSAGGHNGIKSTIQHLGTNVFPRLKIGIGSSQPGNMVGHVLGRFSPDEKPVVENTLATAFDAVQLALAEGIEKAANQYHRRNKPPQGNPPDNPPAPKATDTPATPKPDRP